MTKDDVERAILDACGAFGVPRGSVSLKTILKTVCPNRHDIAELVKHAEHTTHSTLTWKPGRILPQTLGDLIQEVWDQKIGQQSTGMAHTT